MVRAGLTGSIAVGKTFVCQVLAELGCHVLDADNVAREVVKPRTAGWLTIRETFGVEVFAENDELDRKKLGEIVFANEEKRRLLNSIVHPLVIEEQDKWLAQKEGEDPDGIAVIDAALMIESGGYRRFDKLIVIWCRPEVQLERLIKRNFLSREEAERRIASQMSQEEKKKYGDFLIDTSDGFEASRRQTEDLFRQLQNYNRKINS
jgi:dephospho-CoA kinase